MIMNAESLCDEPNKTHFQMLMECKCNGNSVITSNPKLMNRGSCKMCFKLNIYLFFHNFKRLLPLLFRQRSSALSRLSSLYEVKLATGSIYYHPCSSQFKRGINSVATRLNWVGHPFASSTAIHTFKNSTFIKVFLDYHHLCISSASCWNFDISCYLKILCEYAIFKYVRSECVY